MDKKYTITALLLSFMVMSSTAAFADGDVSNAMVYADFSSNSGDDVWYTFNGTKYGGRSWEGSFAGEFDKTKLDLKPNGGNYDGVYEWDTAAYCVDLLQGLNIRDPYESDLLTLDTIGLKRAAWIMDNYSGSGNGTQNAAVQIAIWESVYDSDLSLDAGSFQLNWPTSRSISNMANSYLTAVAGADLNDLQEIYKVAYHKDYQDILVTIPVPASVWLFGSALVGMIGFGKRRKS